MIIKAVVDEIPLETEEQQSLFEWVETQSKIYPELALMFAIPNGGKRHYKTACTLKKEGVMPGVADIFLPVARCGYHGIFIEMKRKKGGRLSANQKKFLKAIEHQGYCYIVPEGWEEAAKWIMYYMTNKFKRRKENEK